MAFTNCDEFAASRVNLANNFRKVVHKTLRDIFYYMREDNYMVKDTQLPLDQFSGFLRIKHVSMEHLSFTLERSILVSILYYSKIKPLMLLMTQLNPQSNEQYIIN